MERSAALVRLDVGRPDHFASLVGFFRNEGPEIGRRAREDHTAQICKSRLHLWIGERRIDFLIEFVDDRAGCFGGRNDAEKAARFVTRNKLAHA
jgi:hypothetical protein